MGKMKEKFIDEMNEHDFGSPSDADYHDYLYHQDRKGEIDNEDDHISVSQEEVENNHKAWWDSLTDEQKEKLFREFKAATNFFNTQES
jgi:hypothetical protein